MRQKIDVGVLLKPERQHGTSGVSFTAVEGHQHRDFTTLNGVRARGGSMNGPAPVVAGGMVYVNSGYGAFGLRPGNVLLAFGAE